MAWAADTPWERMETEAFELFRELLRVNTTNPPGNERAAAEIVVRHLAEVGIEARLLEAQAWRSNVVARLEGAGRAPSLLLDSHLDTVHADQSGWRSGPFSGEVRDGFIWGRGALDMKAMTAMSVAVMKAYARRGTPPKGTLVLACTADEETGSELGAQWLVKQHPQLVKCDFALGEVGGISMTLHGHRVFPVQVAERGLCWMRVRIEGESGHASSAAANTVPLRAARLACELARMRFPMEVQPAAAAFLKGIAPLYPPIPRLALSRLAQGGFPGLYLSLLGRSGRLLRPMLANSLQVTGIHTGSAVNVLPGVAELQVDGRVLPGVSPEDMLNQVAEKVGKRASVEPISMQYGMAIPNDTPMMRAIRKVISKMDPQALVLPTLTAGHTNGSSYASLGVKYLGFTPISMPPTVQFQDLFHAANERCPVDGFKWGVRTLAQVVEAFFEG